MTCSPGKGCVGLESTTAQQTNCQTGCSHGYHIISCQLFGRDSAKKAKATDFVIDKVTEGVAKAVVPMSVGMSSLKTIEDGLSKANTIMQTMVNHQVMAMAPSDICDQ